MENLGKPSDYVYTLEMEVRDYELDSESIVNNSNYLRYMEHTRHRYCSDKGISFIELQKRGIVPVVRRVELDYLKPLRSGDRFWCGLDIERHGPRFIFRQDIFLTDGTPVTRGSVECVMLDGGRLSRGEEVASLFGLS